MNTPLDGCLVAVMSILSTTLSFFAIMFLICLGKGEMLGVGVCYFNQDLCWCPMANPCAELSNCMSSTQTAYRCSRNFVCN